MKAITALKKFFEPEPHGRKVSMTEIKDLTHAERQELGRLAAEALGETFEPTEAKS